MVFKNFKGLVSYLGLVVLSLVLVFISSQILFNLGYNLNSPVYKAIFIGVIGLVAILFGKNLGSYEFILENLLSFIFSLIIIILVYALYLIGQKIPSFNFLVFLGQILLSPMILILQILGRDINFINILVTSLSIAFLYGISGVMFNKNIKKRKSNARKKVIRKSNY